MVAALAMAAGLAAELIFAKFKKLFELRAKK
jgi:hypothetical protein